MSNFIIKLASNTISNSEKSELAKWINNNDYFTKGSLTKKFEEEFSKKLKIKFSTFVNSGSSANLLIAKSLQELHKKKGIRIILPSISWITTVMPFEQLGYDIRLIDCSTDDLGLNVEKLEAMCKKFKPEYVCLVHVLGHLNNMEKIIYLSKKYKFKIIEDNCESIGSSFKNKYSGSFGYVSSCSFYYGHQITTIEGGMVATNDKKLNEILKSVRSHGWARDIDGKIKKKLEKKYNIDPVRSLYTFYYSGFNLRSTEINAKLGLSQIKKIDKIAVKRNYIFNLYSKYLKNYWTQKSNTDLISSFGYATLVKNRTEVFEMLTKNKIETRPLICGNIALQPVWLNKHKKQNDLANADLIHYYGIYLPNHYNLSEKNVKFICDIFKKIAKPIFF
jgi:CDP-6-deoxy-D-xylo-4-hexulose-3-dehydrase